MSKLGCTCGNIIPDTKDHLPHKGRILKDQDDYAFFDAASTELALFTKAVAEGRRDEWISRHFSRDLDDESIIYAFLSGLDEKYTVVIYECDRCGRLWLQKGTQLNQFIPYSPDNGQYHKILASEH